MEGESQRPMRPEKKTLGELNGPWAFLFKVTQIFIPILGLTIIPFCVYVETRIVDYNVRITNLESYREERPKYASAEVEAMRLRIMAEEAERTKNDLEKVTAQAITLADKNKQEMKDVLLALKELTLEIQQMKIELAKHMAVENKKPQ